jgi:hypothetical protein
MGRTIYSSVSFFLATVILLNSIIISQRVFGDEIPAGQNLLDLIVDEQERTYSPRKPGLWERLGFNPRNSNQPSAMGLGAAQISGVALGIVAAIGAEIASMALISDDPKYKMGMKYYLRNSANTYLVTLAEVTVGTLAFAGAAWGLEKAANHRWLENRRLPIDKYGVPGSIALSVPVSVAASHVIRSYFSPKTLKEKGIRVDELAYWAEKVEILENQKEVNLKIVNRTPKQNEELNQLYSEISKAKANTQEWVRRLDELQNQVYDQAFKWSAATRSEWLTRSGKSILMGTALYLGLKAGANKWNNSKFQKAFNAKMSSGKGFVTARLRIQAAPPDLVPQGLHIQATPHVSAKGPQGSKYRISALLNGKRTKAVGKGVLIGLFITPLLQLMDLVWFSSFNYGEQLLVRHDVLSKLENAGNLAADFVYQDRKPEDDVLSSVRFAQAFDSFLETWNNHRILNITPELDYLLAGWGANLIESERDAIIEENYFDWIARTDGNDRKDPAFIRGETGKIPWHAPTLTEYALNKEIDQYKALFKEKVGHKDRLDQYLVKKNQELDKARSEAYLQRKTQLGPVIDKVFYRSTAPWHIAPVDSVLNLVGSKFNTPYNLRDSYKIEYDQLKTTFLNIVNRASVDLPKEANVLKALLESTDGDFYQKPDRFLSLTDSHLLPTRAQLRKFLLDSRSAPQRKKLTVLALLFSQRLNLLRRENIELDYRRNVLEKFRKSEFEKIAASPYEEKMERLSREQILGLYDVFLGDADQTWTDGPSKVNQSQAPAANPGAPVATEASSADAQAQARKSFVNPFGFIPRPASKERLAEIAKPGDKTPISESEFEEWFANDAYNAGKEKDKGSQPPPEDQ